MVVKRVLTHRKLPEVRIWRLRNQSRVGTVPPATSTPHCPACLHAADRAPGYTGARDRSETPAGCLGDDGSLHREELPLHGVVDLIEERAGHRYLGVCKDGIPACLLLLEPALDA